MKTSDKPRVVVIYNRDFEGAEADSENKARQDIADIALNVVGILRGHGFAASGLGVTDDVLGAMTQIKAASPDAVFNLCESIVADNRFEPLLPLLMDMERISYTGSAPLSLSLALHKHRAKDVLRSRGIATPPAVMLSTPDLGPARELGFPLIVKPTREDASVGISCASVVHDARALEERVAHMLSQYRQPALVERYVEGREIYVSVLAQRQGPPQVFPFFEIDFSDMPAELPHIVSFEGKWVEDSAEYRGTRPVRCRGLSPEIEARLAATALSTFEAFELRDYARVDIRLAPDGTPNVIDVNPNCDLSDLAGGFSKAARAAGMSYDAVILRILELALARSSDADAIPLVARSRTAARDPVGRPVQAGGSRVRARAPRGSARPG